jgi:hypothetical protein
MGVFMLLMVLTFAVLFSFTSFMEMEMQGFKRNSFIFLLWLYGVYRAYRLFVLLKNFKKHAA